MPAPQPGETWCNVIACVATRSDTRCRGGDAVEVRTVIEAANAIVTALGIRYGEVTIQVRDCGVVLLRKGETISAGDLEDIPLQE